MDVTVNFRRSGDYSKQVNKVAPFFNANIQGTDKVARWMTAEDVKGKDRYGEALIRRFAEGR